MKRIAMALCAAMGLLIAAQGAQASWGSLGYGGYQPWWNIFAKRNRMSVEEERLQRFWHDYYDSLKTFYHSQEHIDWVSYYKNHGYQINTGGGQGGGLYGMNGGTQRIQFAPVFVSPGMQWAVPNGNLNGPPPGPPGPPMGAYAGPGPGPGPMPYPGPGPMPYPGPGPGPMPYPAGPGPMPFGGGGYPYPPPYGS